MDAWMPLLKDMAGSLGRIVGAILIGWLVQQQVLTADQADSALTSFTASFAACAPLIAWALYRRFTTRQKIVTALGSNAGTEADLDLEIKGGSVASVSTPKHQVPMVTGTGDGRVLR